MPVPLNSRYRRLPVYDAPAPDGSVQPTVAMRLVAPPPGGSLQRRHVLQGTETLEYLAGRYYGDSSAWWRIADANPRVFPLDLKTGSILVVPSPGAIGRIERTRTF